MPAKFQACFQSTTKDAEVNKIGVCCQGQRLGREDRRADFGDVTMVLSWPPSCSCRKSFFSGHASFSMFTMLYLVVSFFSLTGADPTVAYPLGIPEYIVHGKSLEKRPGHVKSHWSTTLHSVAESPVNF